MADKTMERETGKLSLSKGKLGLSKSGDGKIKQSFSHGRSKTVTVEVKRKRSGASEAGVKLGKGSARDVGTLSEEERAARLRALKALQQNKAATAKPAPAEEAASDESAE